MANSFKTLKDGDIVRLALESFHNQLTFLKTINRQYDSRFARDGAKNGGELLIRDPNEYTVRTGAIMDVQDQTETTQTVVLATQKGIDMEFSSVELTLSVDDFMARYIDPAMSRLAADVESTEITKFYRDIFNMTGTPATTPASLVAVRNARARLGQELAPLDNRSLLLDSLAMAATTNSLNALFHKASELERSFMRGIVGEAVGFTWFETEMVPVHTNGTRDDSTPVTDTSAGTFVNGATTLVTTGFDNGDTLKKGDVFTIGTTTDGVLSINRETKQRQAHLQQFVVTADKALDSTDTISIAPTIQLSGAKQNMELVGTAGSMALTNTTGGGSGTGSLVRPQNLAYHKDAFTFVTADLHIEPGQRMSRAVFEGISMRIWRGTDIVNDKFPVRLDVLFGGKTIRPEWAVRMGG
ncbi:MAG: P22 phage major capsid protein family protein [Candidatus Scalindua sp.]